MSGPMGRLRFGLMTICFWFRDVFVPPGRVVREAEVAPGETVLDYGCGTGSYALAAARLAGDSGRVYALDVSPLAVERVKRLAAKEGLANVVTIASACATGLARGSVDVALLYDVLHALGSAESVSGEIHRVLRPGGRLSVSDHHMGEADIVEKVTGRGRFRPAGKGKRTHAFVRIG